MFDLILEEIKAERRAKRRGVATLVVVRPPAPAGPAAVHETWFCRMPHCRQWTSNDAHLRGVCNHYGSRKEDASNTRSR